MSDLVIPALTPEYLAKQQGPKTKAEALVELSYQASAIDALDYGRACVKYARSWQERNRRAAASIRRAIISDAWKDLLYADLKARMRPELYVQVLGANGDFCDISRNPAKNIWQETAVLYKSPAARETPEDPADAEKYRRLIRGTKFDTFWSGVEFELMVFNDLIVWPTVVEVRGEKRLQHNRAAGDTVTAIYDVELGGRAEPYALVFVDTWSDGSKEHERYYWWTPQWRAVFSDDSALTVLDPEKLTPVDDDDVPIANPYGQMVFTYLHVDAFGPSFWNSTLGEDLIELTFKAGRQQTLTSDLFYRAGHKQIVATGASIREGDKTLLDPGALIKILGDGVSAQIVDWTVDFEQRQRIIDNDEARAAGTYGINPERLRKTSYQTAEGARLTERPLEERRAKMREPMCDAERGYRATVIRVAERHRLVEDGDLPDPAVWLEVTHAPIAYPGDPKQQLDVDAAEITLGILSPVDVLQRRFPGISRDDAMARLKRNLDEAAEVAKLKQQNNVPGDPRNRGADDEENGRSGPVVRDGEEDITEEAPPGSPPGQQVA